MVLSNVIVLVVGGVAELVSVCRGLRAAPFVARSLPAPGGAPTDRLGWALKLLRDKSCQFAVVVWRYGPSIVAAPRATRMSLAL
jgi:hypothetical protein